MARTCGQEGHQEGGVGSEHCLAASEPATSKPCTTVQTEQTLISRARPRRRGCRRGPGCEKGPRVAGTSGECRALYSSAGSSLAETRRSDSEAHAEHILCDAVKGPAAPSVCFLPALCPLCLDGGAGSQKTSKSMSCKITDMKTMPMQK